MTSRDFCYWLQGHFEIGKPTALSAAETDMVRRHLSLVFKHEIDPSLDGGSPVVRAERQAIHDGVPVAAVTPALAEGWQNFKLTSSPMMISC